MDVDSTQEVSFIFFPFGGGGGWEVCQERGCRDPRGNITLVWMSRLLCLLECQLGKLLFLKEAY